MNILMLLKKNVEYTEVNESFKFDGVTFEKTDPFEKWVG